MRTTALTFVAGTWFDLKLAVRGLARRPGFAALVVATLAVGIGVNVGLFAYLSYFLRPTMQAPEPQKLVWVHHRTDSNPRAGHALADARSLAESSADVFSAGASFRLFGVSLDDGDRTLHSWGTGTTGRYFELFGATAQIGRLYGPIDDRPGAERVLVLSDHLWRHDFGADPGVVGRRLRLDGRHDYTVVGVTRPGFQGTGIWTGVYAPLGTAQGIVPDLDDPGRLNAFSLLGRLAPGVTVEIATQRLAALARGLDERSPLDEPRQYLAIPVTDPDLDSWNEPVLQGARILMIAVAMLLLLACANIANLLLARAEEKRREVALHAALGTSPWRLGRRLLLESLLLSFTGGIAGLWLGRAVLRLIESYLRQEVPISMGDWGADTKLIVNGPWVAGFFVAVCCGVGILVGVAPALQAAHTNLVTVLRGSGSARAGRFGTRRLLVVGQIALAVVLLVGSALLGRTLLQRARLDPGIDVDGLELATLYMAKETEASERADLFQRILEETRALPGVTTAAVTQRIPLSFLGGAKAEAPAARTEQTVGWNAVGVDYFDTLGVPLLAGRDFEDTDQVGAPPVVLVNRMAAERLWPGMSAVGQELRLQLSGFDTESSAYQVVGVVENHHDRTPAEPVQAVAYLPFRQRPAARGTIALRVSAPVDQPLRRMLHDRFSEVAVIDLSPMSAQLRHSLVYERMNSHFVGGLSTLALLLASIGVFGLITWEVRRRRREIAIRVAVGASRRSVSAIVLGETARLLGLGLLLGVPSSLAVGRLLAGSLQGVAAWDPLVLASVAAVLAAAAGVASLAPLRQSVRIEPYRALRDE